MVTATPYEALVESAASLTGTELIADIDDLDISAASAFLQRNHVALESARRTLGPQCVVPVHYDESFSSENRDHVCHLRNLARAFRAEAFVAAHDDDYRATTKIGIDILELANAVRRGGLETDLLVGIAFSSIAIGVLRTNRTKLDQATRHMLIHELRRLEAEREHFDDIVARDRDWQVALGCEDAPCNFNWEEMNSPELRDVPEEERKKLLQLLQQTADLPKPVLQQFMLDQDRHVLALMRMLAIDLALRDRYDSSGAFAEELSSLAPDFLPKLPVDPYTDTSFIYRRVGDKRFQLYSTGPKMRDGGGQIGPWPLVAAGCADLYLDAGDYWSACCSVPRRQGFVYRIASAIRGWYGSRRVQSI
ncbi:MAG TPA: hypothetical protein VND64_01110 [Pirellulales bacterium]|nr:hypothetical protein [Pirellulales bacterium]